MSTDFHVGKRITSLIYAIAENLPDDFDKHAQKKAILQEFRSAFDKARNSEYPIKIVDKDQASRLQHTLSTNEALAALSDKTNIEELSEGIYSGSEIYDMDYFQVEFIYKENSTPDSALITYTGPQEN